MGTQAPIKTLIRFEGSFGNFVDAMSAVVYFANKVTNVVFTFYSPQEEYIRTAKSYWCVKNVVREYNAQDYDVVVDMTSDIEDSIRYELAYRGAQKRNIDTQILQIAQQKGVDPEQVQKPREYNMYAQPNPIYNRQHSYLIKLIYELLAPVEIPYDFPIEMPKAPGTKDEVNKMLHAYRSELKPGVPYLLISNGELLRERNLTIPFPENWGVLSLDMGGVDASIIAGLVTNPRCIGVVSKAGELGRIASINKTKFLVEFSDNKELLGWECTRCDDNMLMEVNEEYADNSLFMAAITTHLRTCFGYNELT